MSKDITNSTNRAMAPARFLWYFLFGLPLLALIQSSSALICPSFSISRSRGSLLILCESDGTDSQQVPKRRAVKGSAVKNDIPAEVVSSSKRAKVKGRSKSKSKLKKKKEEGPAHWVDENDKVTLEYDNNGKVTLVRFTIRGNPRPLVRHRSMKGWTYNPSAKLQNTFSKLVADLVFESHGLHAPLFDEGDNLVMTILFQRRRPNLDFVGNKRGVGRLRPKAAPRTTVGKCDIDNLTKFVLDSLNEVLYPDDSQILSLHVTRLRDNEGLCEGSTEICLRSISDDEIEAIRNNSFRITEKRSDSEESSK